MRGVNRDVLEFVFFSGLLADGEGRFRFYLATTTQKNLYVRFNIHTGVKYNKSARVLQNLAPQIPGPSLQKTFRERNTEKRQG